MCSVVYADTFIHTCNTYHHNDCYPFVIAAQIEEQHKHTVIQSDLYYDFIVVVVWLCFNSGAVVVVVYLVVDNDDDDDGTLNQQQQQLVVRK